jgi:8-amino-7-oxononanoate synthase
MNDFEIDLSQRLAEIGERGLYRELRRVDSPQGPVIQVGGCSLLNFSSNDYLGLANNPILKTAAGQALDRFGVGSGASRLVCGSLAPHHLLEETLAAFKGTEAALVFSSGYATALGSIGALLEKQDVIVLDKRVHACLVDAARLSGAKLRVFAHNDPASLEKILRWADTRRLEPSQSGGAARKKRVLIVTESVFSMDGDLAPLRELVALKEKYGAWLMLDEAHATGLFGEKRRGLAEALALADRVEVQMGTLGKALGTAGGYICGSRALADFLVNRARSFIFSTAPAPAMATAAVAAIGLVQTKEGEMRRCRVWDLVNRLKTGLMRGLGLVPPTQSTIIPLVVGGEAQAVGLARALQTAGIFVPAIRYPTVARGTARLRLTLTAAHRESDVDRLLDVLAHLKAALRLAS